MTFVKFINKENLRIARENMGLDSATASKGITTSKKNLVSLWESGDLLPTWSQVTKIAKVYNIPDLTLFSKETIQKDKAVPDYRVGANPENDKQVKKLINLVITRQKSLERILKEEGFSKNTLQGTGKKIDSPKKLAEFIAKTLGVKIDDIRGISGVGSRKKVLNYLIQKAEKQGIFIGKTISYHKLEVEDIRGLFISNDYCPFIILNRRDAVSAQIFSLVHELTHFFRKSDAVSNSLDFRSKNKNINPEEVFCNKVAAELLLPEQEFVKEFYDKSDINRISELYKVSKIFIFYRLKDLGKIQSEIQHNLEREIKAEINRDLKVKAENEQGKAGGNYTNAMKDSNGALFNRIVASSFLENKIGYVEASNMLRFSVENV